MRAKSRITLHRVLFVACWQRRGEFRSRRNSPLEDGRPESIGWSVWVDWQSSRRGLIPRWHDMSAAGGKHGA
jgi:hypothetical protein